MNKKDLTMLEKVFAAEIEGRLPFQTRSKVAEELANEGFLQVGTRNFGRVEVSGYYLTHAGRIAYCTSCQGDDEP